MGSYSNLLYEEEVISLDRLHHHHPGAQFPWEDTIKSESFTVHLVLVRENRLISSRISDSVASRTSYSFSSLQVRSGHDHKLNNMSKERILPGLLKGCQKDERESFAMKGRDRSSM